MSLTAGTRLGPYEIVSAIGAGGMGEVYRATDCNLKRSVAIKVLPAAMASDADRLARFQREAEALAALNHPNIAAIYGLEKTATLTALVMELVEGEDLSAHMARGAMPLSELLPIARQIAEALEAAHEQGIIHRDIKPANVKVRADGVVKVLDFGLAKAMEPAGAASAEAMNSPTLTARATQLGVILGTAAYMAPEQARGRIIDKRVDIWAFGVVVFEMLAGTRAFSGDDITDTIVSVVSKEPDWSALPPGTPAGLRRLLTRCLKKDPKARLRDIGDARLQIDDLIAAPEEGSALPPSTSLDHARGALGQSRRARALPWAVAGALAVALVSALWAPWRAATTARAAAFRLTPLSFEQGGQTGAVWSPDGKAVAYGARQTEADPYQAYVRYLDSPVAMQVTTTGVTSVVTWTTAGKIVFLQGGRLWSVSPVGGEPEPFEKTGVIDPALRRLGKISVSRDGRAAALFLGADNVRLWLWSPASSQRLYEPAPFASPSVLNQPIVEFSPDGKQILLLRNSGAGEEAWLMPSSASAADPPHRVLPGVSAFTDTPTASWMPDNRHVVLSASPTALLRDLYLGDTVTGALTIISSGTADQNSPAASPDGSKLVFLETRNNYDIVSVDLATAAVTSVIATQRGEQMPAWAAREPAMVYVTDRNGAFEIWLQKAGQPDRPLVTARNFPPGQTRGFMGPALSPDGTRIIYRWLELTGSSGLWISAVAGGGSPEELMTSSGSSYPGSWSPDGNWYVYRHTEGGRESLVKVKTTVGAEPELLKAPAERSRIWVPVWSPANDWILFEDKGVKLISPDGRTTREVSPTSALAYTFSSDGRTIYGLRQAAPLGPVELFSIRVADGSEKLIGSLARDFLPSTSHGPALRLSVTPDGRSLTYSINRRSSNLWLMDGLKSVTGK